MAWRIHSRFHSCTSSHVGVHFPLSLVRTDGGILAALTDETFDASSGARDRAAEKKDILKKSLQSSCSSLIPSNCHEKNLMAQRGSGVAILCYPHTNTYSHAHSPGSLWDKTTHPDWNNSWQFGLQMWSEKRGAEHHSKERKGVLAKLHCSISQALCVPTAILLG